MSSRQSDTDAFYKLLDELGTRLGGPRMLKDCTGSTGWPRYGVYFFFEEGECRVNGAPRVVRIGTHALVARSKHSLWNRLSNHRGNVGGSNPGGGNHRGSIFREHIGTPLLKSGEWPYEVHKSWRDKNDYQAGRQAEQLLERAVSGHIGEMPFLWLEVPDPADRKVIESNSIGILSRRQDGVDAESPEWLGLSADSEKVRTSALWNVMCVDDDYNPNFLGILDRLVRRVGKNRLCLNPIQLCHLNK